MQKKQNEEVYKLREDAFYYYGYIVEKDGRIISPNGKEIKSYTITYPGSHITIKVGEKHLKKNKAKLIYTLFSNANSDITRTHILLFKDKNTYNASYDNLYIVSRREYMQQNGTRGQAKFTEPMKNQIRSEYTYQKEPNSSSKRTCQKV